MEGECGREGGQGIISMFRRGGGHTVSFSDKDILQIKDHVFDDYDTANDFLKRFLMLIQQRHLNKSYKT